MSSSQDFKVSDNRTRRPYESVLQLVETYLVSECVVEIRSDSARKTDSDLAKTVKPIDPFFDQLEDEIKDSIEKQNNVVFKAKEAANTSAYSDAMYKLAKLKKDLYEFEIHKEQLIDSYKKACKLCQYEPFRVCLLFYAIKDMFVYSFYNQPSMIKPDYQVNMDLDQDNTGESFEAYSSYNLLFHTIHVFSQAVNSAIERNLLGSELSVLSALLHDYGKSEGIITEIDALPNQKRNEKGRYHQEYSGYYVYFLLRQKVKKRIYTSLGPSWEQEHSDEVEADFKNIQRTVTLHHIPESNEKPIDDSISFVKAADKKAREKEKELYFNDFIPWRDDVKDKITESIMSEHM